MLGLLLLLGAVALVGLRPWATTSLVPNLRISPGLGPALGDSTVVAQARSIGVAEAHVLGTGSSTSVAEPVAVSTPDAGGPKPVPAVSQGRPVQGSGTIPTPPSPEAEPPPAPAPVVATPGPAPTSPTVPASAQPLTAGVENGAQGGPGTAVMDGVDDSKGQACEGDEYTVTVTFEAGEAINGESGVDILVQRLVSGESVSELQLEGDWNDVGNLVDLLVSEGNCVQVKPFRDGDPAQEALETGTDTAELGDTLESVPH